MAKLYDQYSRIGVPFYLIAPHVILARAFGTRAMKAIPRASPYIHGHGHTIASLMKQFFKRVGFF
jgi:hypothetical protein